MRRSDLRRRNATPLRIEPHFGQVSENSSESARSEHWAVLHEREPRSYLANDSGHFSPESGAFAVDSRPASDLANVLAWEAARNHVNNSAPRLSVKGANVIPNRERREKAVILSGDKNARGVGLALDSAHGSPAKQVAAEYSSTSPGEEGEFA